MTTKFEAFKALHRQRNPLLLGNVWDANSAIVLQKLGYKALGTSSAAVASVLGYADGENMPFSEYRMIIARMMEHTEVPVSVDLEAGYGNDPNEVVELIKELAEMGVVGINLEDSLVQDNVRTLMDAEEFATKLGSIHDKLKEENVRMFINLRIDTFLLQTPNALEASKERIDWYSNFIDGVFLPCIADPKNIAEIVQHTRLPVNVMTVPDLPDFSSLKDLGVKRISTGNFGYELIYQTFKEHASSLLEDL